VARNGSEVFPPIPSACSAVRGGRDLGSGRRLREFCTEAIRSQIFFEKNGRYKASNYAEVLEECYHSEITWRGRYLPGQFLSHFIWPHHRKMLRGYVERFPAAAGEIKLFYEVGVDAACIR